MGVVEYASWSGDDISIYAAEPELLQIALSKGHSRSIICTLEHTPSPDVKNRSHAFAFYFYSHRLWVIRDGADEDRNVDQKALDNLGFAHYTKATLFRWTYIPFSAQPTKVISRLATKLSKEGGTMPQKEVDQRLLKFPAPQPSRKLNPVVALSERGPPQVRIAKRKAEQKQRDEEEAKDEQLQEVRQMERALSTVKR